jgi:hypothetical protein
MSRELDPLLECGHAAQPAYDGYTKKMSLDKD